MPKAVSRSLAAALGVATITGVGSFALPAQAHADTSSGCTASTVSPGDSGGYVPSLQWRLGVPMTGSDDATTVRATQVFQANNRMAATGVVDAATWAKLPHGAPGCSNTSSLRIVTSSRQGDSGSLVASLRWRLGLGYQSNVFDAQTTAALKSFQSQHGLVADGVAGPMTWLALPHAQFGGGSICSGPTVTPASSGWPVASLRWRLGMGTSGSYDSAVSSAVRAFQADSGMTPNGVVDADTWAKLPYGAPGCQNTSALALLPALQEGSDNSYVPLLRWRLGLDYHSNIFDAATTAALKSFQSANGQDPNGVVGPATWRQLPHGEPTQSGPSPISAPAPVPQTVTRYVTSDDAYANVRSQPSLGSTILSHDGSHSRVTGTIEGQWLKTSDGYVNLGTLNVSSNPPSTNGRIPLSSLCKVPLAYNADHSFAPGYTVNTQRYLNCDALAGLNSLESAYRSHFGTWATIDLTYRSLAEQQYWYNKYGSPRAATPGTSNHGYGIAIDFQENDGYSTFDWGQPGWSWLNSNAGNYGFNNPFAYGTDGESYHHNFVG